MKKIPILFFVFSAMVCVFLNGAGNVEAMATVEVVTTAVSVDNVPYTYTTTVAYSFFSPPSAYADALAQATLVASTIANDITNAKSADINAVANSSKLMTAYVASYSVPSPNSLVTGNVNSGGPYSVTNQANNTTISQGGGPTTFQNSPSCGDNVCNGGETCGSCPFDCGSCVTPPPPTPPPAPIDGGWSLWGACGGALCGTGTQTRTCTNPPRANGGADCVGASNQSCSLGLCCTPNTCADYTSQTKAYCASTSKNFAQGCSLPDLSCQGTRLCDFNWKEVAP